MCMYSQGVAHMRAISAWRVRRHAQEIVSIRQEQVATPDALCDLSITAAPPPR